MHSLTLNQSHNLLTYIIHIIFSGKLASGYPIRRPVDNHIVDKLTQEFNNPSERYKSLLKFCYAPTIIEETHADDSIYIDAISALDHFYYGHGFKYKLNSINSDFRGKQIFGNDNFMLKIVSILYPDHPILTECKTDEELIETMGEDEMMPERFYELLHQNSKICSFNKERTLNVFNGSDSLLAPPAVVLTGLLPHYEVAVLTKLAAYKGVDITLSGFGIIGATFSGYNTESLKAVLKDLAFASDICLPDDTMWVGHSAVIPDRLPDDMVKAIVETYINDYYSKNHRMFASRELLDAYAIFSQYDVCQLQDMIVVYNKYERIIRNGAFNTHHYIEMVKFVLAYKQGKYADIVGQACHQNRTSFIDIFAKLYPDHPWSNTFCNDIAFYMHGVRREA